MNTERFTWNESKRLIRKPIMKSESYPSGKLPEKNKTTSQPESLTDWARIDSMRDEDIILDDEHPEADLPHMTNIKIWKNGNLVRDISKEDQERTNNATASALIPSSRPR